jgi:membrane protease subunit (stomatin/prohibitin family)
MLDGIHALEIELYGKTYKNTILDNNKIIDDQSVTLKNIWIDNVQILDFVKYKGIYHVKNEMLPQTLTWKQNGSWKLHFEYPINKWIQETQPSIYSNT